MAYNKGATFVTSRYQVDGETLDIQEALNETIEDVSSLLSSNAKKTTFFATISDMASANTTPLSAGDVFEVAESGRGGRFTWSPSDRSSEVSSDPMSGVWVPPSSDPTGASGAFLRSYFKTINVLWFGAKGDGVTDDTAALQAAYDYLPAFCACYHPAGDYAISSMLTWHTSRTTLFGDGKYLTIIKPLASFDRTTYDSLLEGGDGVSSNNQVIRNMGVSASYSSDGNDLSGLCINSYYNFDVNDCQMKSGNYVNRENGGILIKQGKHTRISNSHLHNGYCYGVVINKHLEGLKFIGCDFDETTAHIVSTGDVLDISILGCELGQAIDNSGYPPPVQRTQIDMTRGNHGHLKVNSNIMDGSLTTRYGVVIGNCDHTVITGNSFENFQRFSIAHTGSKDMLVSGNSFSGGGSEGTESDPSLGTRDYETTPYCCDIFKRSAFNFANVITSNTTDLDRPMAWLEGTSGVPDRSGTTIMANSCPNGAAYVHGVLVTDSSPFVVGDRLIPALPTQSFQIPSHDYAAGQTQYGSFSYTGLEVGDSLTINPQTTGMTPGLILRAEVVDANTGRWYVTNASGVDVTAEPERDFVASATKG